MARRIRSLRVETATGRPFPVDIRRASPFYGFTDEAASPWLGVCDRQRPDTAGGVVAAVLGCPLAVDVAGAIVLGTLSVLLADFAFEYADQKGIKWLNLLLLIPVAAAAVIWQDFADFVKSAATISGFDRIFIGDQFHRFDVKAPVWKQVVKFILYRRCAGAKGRAQAAFPTSTCF